MAGIKKGKTYCFGVLRKILIMLKMSLMGQVLERGAPLLPRTC